MTPVLVLRCQCMLSSVHFPPSAGALRDDAVVWIVWMPSVMGLRVAGMLSLGFWVS